MFVSIFIYKEKRYLKPIHNLIIRLKFVSILSGVGEDQTHDLNIANVVL